MRVSDRAELNAALGVLVDRREWWARLSAGERIDLARRSIVRSLSQAEAMVHASCEAKRIDPRGPASAEEWLAGPLPIVRNLRLLIETLTEIERDGRPALDRRDVARTPTGELVVDVFPADRYERLFYPGSRIDVWMRDDVDETNIRDTMGVAYRVSAPGRVALVLGAGNIASIGPMDVLYKLFVENQVVVLKMHPVNDYLGPIIERAFEPLVSAGCLRIAYGDAAEGHYLVHHPLVDDVHMTGSVAVHDRIVWGDTPQEQLQRRTHGTPKVTKRITSELGCVTPVIVLPDSWSPAELAYQAENVATMVAHNASCNCNAAKLLVTWRGWPQRRAFLERVEHILSTLPARYPYYPGSIVRYERFIGAHNSSRPLGARTRESLPYTTIFDVDPDDRDNVAFREEAWCPILAETPLHALDEGEFLDAAVRFCNQRVAGTLSAVMLVHPRTRKRLGTRVDRAMSDLRYGTIAVNHWAAMSYALGVTPWGAYPGHTLQDVSSGIGFVHNTRMFDRPLKTVVWGPFTATPKPAWFCTHKTAHIVARRTAAFEASPAFWRVPAIAAPALRG